MTFDMFVLKNLRRNQFYDSQWYKIAHTRLTFKRLLNFNILWILPFIISIFSKSKICNHIVSFITLRWYVSVVLDVHPYKRNKKYAFTTFLTLYATLRSRGNHFIMANSTALTGVVQITASKCPDMTSHAFALELENRWCPRSWSLLKSCPYLHSIPSVQITGHHQL